LLSEISLPKLLTAWLVMLVVPCLVLGLSPLIVSAWAVKVFGNISFSYAGVWPIILLATLLAVGWLGGRPLFRLAERSFWSLNSLIVEPCYAVAREGLQQVIERPLPERLSKIRRGRWRAAASAAAGILICALALLVLILVWPSSRWVGNISDLIAPLHLARDQLVQQAQALGLQLDGEHVHAPLLVARDEPEILHESPQQPLQEQNERDNQRHKRKPHEQRMNGRHDAPIALKRQPSSEKSRHRRQQQADDDSSDAVERAHRLTTARANTATEPSSPNSDKSSKNVGEPMKRTSAPCDDIFSPTANAQPN